MMSQTSLKQLSMGPTCIVMLLAIGVYFLPLSAQNPELPEPVISQVLPANITWSVDSRRLAFKDTASASRENDWYAYDLTTKELTLTSYWPLTPTVIPTQQSMLTDRIGLDSGDITLLSKSPDDRYLVFGIVNSEEIVTSYGSFPSIQPGLADLKQGSVAILPDLELPGIKNVLWSTDNNALILTQTIVPYDWVNIQYIGNFTTNVSTAITRDLRGGLWIEDTGYAVNGAYDLSENGERALLRVNVPASTRTLKLYIYNARYPGKDQLIEEFDANGVIAGSFAPGDESKLWLLNEIGVVQYDLVTDETTILNTSANALFATTVTLNDPAIFSPDGRYLATLGPQGLYIIDLTEEAARLATGTPVPIPAVGSDALRRLWLTVDCPTEPVASLTWTVHNPNMEAVNVTWVQDFRPETEGTPLAVPGGSEDLPGVATFATAVEPGNSRQVRILVDGVFHDTRGCFVPREG